MVLSHALALLTEANGIRKKQKKHFGFLTK
jgi:hypothetical protein